MRTPARSELVAFAVLLLIGAVRAAEVTTTPLLWYGLGDVRCGACSVDGCYVLTGGSAGAFLWEVATGRLVRTFVAQEGHVGSLAFSPDGKKIATLSLSSYVPARIWDTSNGSLLATISEPDDEFRCLAFSPDGTKILTGTAGRKARLWNAANGALLRTICQNLDWIESVAFSPDGTKVLIGYYWTEAQLWNVADGVFIRSFLTESDYEKALVAFSPDGNRVLCAGKTGGSSPVYDTRVWNASNGNLLFTVSGHVKPITAAMFSPDGTTILTGSSDGVVKIRNATSGTLIRTLTLTTATANLLALSPDGTKVLTASNDLTVNLWRISDGALLRTFSGHRVVGAHVTVSPDGRRVLTGSVLWNASNATILRTFSGSCVSGTFSQDGSKILFGENRGSLNYDPRNPLPPDGWLELRNMLDETIGHFDMVSSAWTEDAAYSRDGTKAVWGGQRIMYFPTVIIRGGLAVLFAAQSGKEVWRYYDGRWEEACAVAISPDGTKVAVSMGSIGYGPGNVVLLQASNGSVIRSMSDFTRVVNSVAFSPDGRTLLTGSKDQTANLWSISSGTLLCTFSGHAAEVLDVAFSPNGSAILTASMDGTARLWRTSDGTLLRTFAGHAHWIRSVAFSPDGMTVLTGSNDGTAKLWASGLSPQSGSTAVKSWRFY